MARNRITKKMLEVNKENVIDILVIWGHNKEETVIKVNKYFDMAIKAMPSDDAVGVANYLAHF